MRHEDEHRIGNGVAVVVAVLSVIILLIPRAKG